MFIDAKNIIDLDPFVREIVREELKAAEARKQADAPAEAEAKAKPKAKKD